MGVIANYCKPSGGNMDTFMTIRMESETKDKIAEMAKREHRSAAGQAKYLIEKAMSAIEDNSTQARELADYMNAVQG